MPTIPSTAWGKEQLTQLARAAWFVSTEERTRLCHPNSRCPTQHAPYGPADPYGARIHPACLASNCIDMLHELLTRMMTKFSRTQNSIPGRQITNPQAYANQMAKAELVELRRAARTANGFSAKPNRNDGIAGRINIRLGDEGEHAVWLTALFRIMRSYPFSPHHVRGRWPIDGLCLERAKLLPVEATAAQVNRDIARVLLIATEVAGRKWVFENLILPLNSNGPAAELDDQQPTTCCDPDDAILCAELRRTYLRARVNGEGREMAYRRAVLQTTGRIAPPLAADILTCLIELDDEILGVADGSPRSSGHSSVATMACSA